MVFEILKIPHPRVPIRYWNFQKSSAATQGKLLLLTWWNGSWNPIWQEHSRESVRSMKLSRKQHRYLGKITATYLKYGKAFAISMKQEKSDPLWKKHMKNQTMLMYMMMMMMMTTTTMMMMMEQFVSLKRQGCSAHVLFFHPLTGIYTFDIHIFSTG